MDIMVDKHNSQNAKIGLERTPTLSSLNFNQKKTPPDCLFKIKECQKYTAKFYNVSTYFICALFLLLQKYSLDMILVHKKQKLYNLSSKKKMQQT